MPEFLNMYSLKNLVSQKTCFKNPENLSCIDLILTNCSRSFLTLVFLKQGCQIFTTLHSQSWNNTILNKNLRSCNFRNGLFTSELENELSNYDINNMKYDIFLWTILKIFLRQIYSYEKKYLRANQATFMTKEVRKAIMIRSKLKVHWCRLENFTVCSGRC